MISATLPCLRKVAIAHPEGNFSSLMCLEEHWELLQLACPFPCLEPRREGQIDVCQGRAFFSPICQLSLASCYCSALFPWKRMVPVVFKLCNKANSSQDQARFLLHRPRSGQEPSSVQMSWWIYLPGWVVLLSWCLRTFFTFPTDFCRGI